MDEKVFLFETENIRQKVLVMPDRPLSWKRANMKMILQRKRCQSILVVFVLVAFATGVYHSDLTKIPETPRNPSGVGDAFIALPNESSEPEPVSRTGVQSLDIPPPESPPNRDELIIYMATDVFNSRDIPDGIRPHQIAREADSNGGYVDCGDKRVKASVTYDSRASDKADFWIFHCRDQPDADEMKRMRRRPHQLWTWFCEEHDNIEPAYEGLYNLTMSMRLESDIPISYLNTDRNMVDSLGHEWDTKGVEPMVPFAERTAVNPVAWAASNCDQLLNNRTGYIEELMKHIGVDSFGPCLNTAEGFTERGGQIMGRERLEKEKHFMRRYKFYLSFENANCKGYVSEKLPKAFIWNLVPIIGGPPDGMRHTPTSGAPPSAIHAKDFANAAALASFLKMVAADEKLYDAYHSWRSSPDSITTDFRKNFPPQSKRPHDICKFVAAWHYQRTGGRIAKPFDECLKPGPKTGWV